MRNLYHGDIDRFRIRSSHGLGNHLAGSFLIPHPRTAVKLRAVVSSGEIPGAGGWDHVSVSLPNRCPNWIEMCFVKDLFFEPEDVCMQLHPAHSEYVNVHPYCLHIWRPTARGLVIPKPPAWMVGPVTTAGEPVAGANA